MISSRRSRGDSPPADALIGRKDELDRALAVWQRVLGGERKVLLLLGEPGIGKTRLAEEISVATRNDGSAAYWGRAWESGGAPALWPWIQILRGLWDGESARDARAALGNRAALIAPLVEGVSDDEDLSSAEADQRFALFDAVSSFLALASMTQPTTLVLDDLHVADLTSLHLLHFLSRAREPGRLLLIGTSRTNELRSAEAKAAAVADIEREGQALYLRGLSRDDTFSLARALDPQLSRGVAEDVRVATGGNPLLIKEIARTGALGDPGSRRAGSIAVREALRRRIRSSRANREILSAAAVLGRQIAPGLLAEVMQLTSDEVEAQLQRAVDEELLLLEKGSNEFVFVHELVRATLYDDLPAETRRRIHLAAATALQEGAGGPAHHVDLIAHHFEQAGSTAGKEAVRYLLTSGELAARRFAYEAAQERFRRALELVGDDRVTSCELLIALGTAQKRMGDQAGNGSLLQAATIARDLGDGDRLAVALITLVATSGGNPYVRTDELITRIEQALELVPPSDPAVRARLLSSLLGLLWEPEDRSRRAEILQEALALGRGAGDLALAEVLYAAASSLYFERAPAQQSYVEDLVEVARRLRRSDSVHVQLRGRELEINARRIRTVFALEEGDTATFERDAAYVIKAAEELRQPYFQVAAGCLRCVRDQMVGRMVEMEQRAASFQQILPDDMLSTVAGFVETGWALFEQGRLAEIRELTEALLEDMPRLVGLRLFLAIDAIRDGRLSDARALVAPVTRDLTALPFDASWFSFLAGLAWIARELGDEATCSELYEALTPHRERHVVISFRQASGYVGAVELYLGMTAAVAGDPQVALAHLESSLHRHEGIGATAWAARSEYEMARLLASSDHARSRVLVESALERLVGTSMKDLRAQLEALGRQLKTSASSSLPTLVRDGDTWILRLEEQELRVRAMRGLEYLARLLSAPGQEFHAADLLSGGSRAEQVSDEHGSPRRQMEPLLDDRAVAEYRKRLADLQEDIDEATSHNDAERVSRLRGEMDLLVDELGKASGLGGRTRAFSDDDEKARISVTKAIKRAINAIAALDPDAGRHLEENVATGTFCAYRP